MAKVLVVMTYLDSSKEALMGPRGSAEVFKGQEGALHSNSKVRSILQDSAKIAETHNADTYNAAIRHPEEKKAEPKDGVGQPNPIKDEVVIEKEEKRYR